MQSERGTSRTMRRDIILVGTGAHTEDFEAWLQHLAGRHGLDSSRVSIVSIRDFDQLLDAPLRGRVIVDADLISPEDVGLLARRVRRDGAELVLFGEDAGRSASRRLLFDFDARWISWPPDVRTLESLVGTGDRLTHEKPAPPRAEREANRLADLEAAPAEDDGEEEFTLRPVRSTSTGFGLAPGELEEIEAILGGRESGTLTSEQSSFPTFPPLEEEPSIEVEFPEADDSEFRTDFDPEPEREPAAEPDDQLDFSEDPFAEESFEAPRLSDSELELLESELADTPAGTFESEAEPHEPPVWFKDQVADLADHVQRLELTLSQAQDEGIDVHGPFGEGRAIERNKLAEIQDETARLGQFTRTLSFLAAPPARGEQLFDLRTLLEEQVRSQAGGEGAPRFMMRIPEILPVRSNKSLLLQAFDALLFLARRCTHAQGTVRVEAVATHAEDDPGHRRAHRLRARPTHGSPDRRDHAPLRHPTRGPRDGRQCRRRRARHRSRPRWRDDAPRGRAGRPRVEDHAAPDRPDSLSGTRPHSEELSECVSIPFDCASTPCRSRVENGGRSHVHPERQDPGRRE